MLLPTACRGWIDMRRNALRLLRPTRKAQKVAQSGDFILYAAKEASWISFVVAIPKPQGLDS